MIITLTENAKGQRRVYLGGKSSLECWIEPKADGNAWTFHIEPAVAGVQLSNDERRAWGLHTLKILADELGVDRRVLPAVPFPSIAALHTADPYLERRVASPKRRVIENGYTAVSHSPSLDFDARDYGGTKHRRPSIR